MTIAFLDSGFSLHPDLTMPENRIVAFHDVSGEDASLDEARSVDGPRMPRGWEWHGTQTSVAACGNGFLSDGFYRGIASDARLVLVKVSAQGRIRDEDIVRGLEWVIDAAPRYGIRVVNISLGGDADIPYRDSALDLLAEKAVRRGLVLVVAAGNSGHTERHRPIPPANAPSVITVGGYDDRNQESPAGLQLYHSNFGPTSDGIVKPEIVAPAAWVAVPILQATSAYERAVRLSELASAPDYMLSRLARELGNELGLADPFDDPQVIRSQIDELLRTSRLVATHYQEADGTSFAAPIISSVIAQMLEANPRLSPEAVKNILVSTADRIRGAPAVRQGYGALNARCALELAAREQHDLAQSVLSPPRVENGLLVFTYHDDVVTQVGLAGDFNGWDPARTPLRREADGLWRAAIPIPPRGRYRYKLVVDGERWLDDPSNGYKEPDEFEGFNSVLNVD